MNQIFFSANKKLTENSYRSEQILKTSVSDSDKTIEGQKIIEKYINSSQQRLKTTQFIENKSKSNNLRLKNILSPQSMHQELFLNYSPKQYQSSRGINKSHLLLQKLLNPQDNISRRKQIQEIENYFVNEINQNNRQEYIQKIETFISDILAEELKELSNLFNFFMKEIKFQLIQQESNLKQNRKALEQSTKKELIQLQEQFTNKKEELLLQQVKLQRKIDEKQIEIENIEKDLQESQSKNKLLNKKLEIKTKYLTQYQLHIKQQESEITILKQKINYLNEKLTTQKILTLQQQQYISRQGSILQNQVIDRKSSCSSFKNYQQQILLNSQSLNDKQEDKIQEDTSNSFIIDFNEQKEYEQLNQVEINYERVIIQFSKEIQIENDLKLRYSKNVETQTILELMNPQFNILVQSNISNVAKYAEFLESLGKKQSEEILVNQFIDEAIDQIDATFSLIQNKKIEDSQISQNDMQKSGSSQNQNSSRRPTILRCDTTLLGNPMLMTVNSSKKDGKIKQILSYMNFQKQQIQELDKELKEKQQLIYNQIEQQKQQSEQNYLLQSENDKLQQELLALKQNTLQSIAQFDQQSETVIDVIEQNNNTKKNQIQHKQQKEIKKQKKEFQLGQKVAISYEFQKDQSKILIEKIKSKSFQKFQNFMPLKLILKYITSLYNEKIQSQKEQKGVKDQDMAAFIYNFYLQQFGYGKVTEQKFYVLVLSIKKNLKIIRINLFAKFLGLLENGVNYSIEELQKYLEAQDFMNTQQNLGINISNNDAEIKHYVPYVRALAYISQILINQSSEEQLLFKQEIESMKESDPKNINKQGIIDFDLMMIRVLQIFRNNVEKTKLYVINAFAASDLDGNGMCNLDEFLILNKYIEDEKFDEEKLIDIFEENADLLIEEEKNLSFDKFSIICLEYDLFSDKSQNKFLQIKNNNDIQNKFDELFKIWETKFNYFKELLQSSNLDQQQKLQWQTILNALNKKILENSVSHKPILIAYKIFENETNQIK